MKPIRIGPILIGLSLQMVAGGKGVRVVSRQFIAGCRIQPPYFFGRNAFTTASFVVKYGPSMRSTQYGIAGNTAIRQSRMALGLPGRLTTSDRPRMPAVCRDRIAVG